MFKSNTHFFQMTINACIEYRELNRVGSSILNVPANMTLDAIVDLFAGRNTGLADRGNHICREQLVILN